MPLSVTHTFVSAIPDDADATLVRPSNWNAAHTVTGTVDVADIAGTIPATAGGTGQTTYAKGDILASPGSNTLNKLPVGTDTFVLTADAASTNGIKWAAASTGSPAGSGTEIQYRNSTAFGAMAGTAWDNTNRSLTMTGATVTTSNPVLDLSQTWNAGAVTFTGLKLAITNTASAAASKCLEILGGAAGTTSIFAITPVGNVGIGKAAFTPLAPLHVVGANGRTAWTAVGDETITLENNANVALTFVASATGFGIVRFARATAIEDGKITYDYTNTRMSFGVNQTNLRLSLEPSNLRLTSGALFGWSSSATDSSVASDTILGRAAAATLQFGAADAAAAVAQTTQVQSVVAGTAGNVAGQDWTFNASKGVGSGVGGNFIFQCAPASSGGGGTAQNIATQVFKISGGAATAAAVPSIQVGSGSTTSTGWISGYLGTSGVAGLWTTAQTPSTTNFILYTSSANTRIQAPSGTGNVSVYTGGGTEIFSVIGAAPTEIYIHQNWPLALGDETILRDVSAGTLGLGRVDAATAVAQTIQVQSVVAGTAGNVAGQDWTFIGSKGVGSGVGGDFVFKTAIASSGGGGTAQNLPTETFRIKNAGGATLVGTLTALQWTSTNGLVQVSEASGYCVTNGTVGFVARVNGANKFVVQASTAQIADNAYSFGWGTTLGTPDTILTRGGAAATIQHGAADAASPVAQIISVQSVSAGTSGVAGALWTFQGSRSTGTAAGGDIAFFLSPNPGIAAATTQNTAVEHHRLLAAGNFKFTNAANFSANGSVATVLGSLGPTGAQTTVQKWLTFVDNGGTTRYVPCF